MLQSGGEIFPAVLCVRLAAHVFQRVKVVCSESDVIPI
jgi:hypothetical protein